MHLLCLLQEDGLCTRTLRIVQPVLPAEADLVSSSAIRAPRLGAGYDCRSECVKASLVNAAQVPWTEEQMRGHFFSYYHVRTQVDMAQSLEVHLSASVRLLVIKLSIDGHFRTSQTANSLEVCAPGGLSLTSCSMLCSLCHIPLIASFWRQTVG
jgi:hypothetical protein